MMYIDNFYCEFGNHVTNRYPAKPSNRLRIMCQVMWEYDFHRDGATLPFTDSVIGFSCN